MQPNDRGISTLHIILIVAAAMAVVLGLVVFFWHSHGVAEQAAGAGTILTEEQKAYLPQLEFTGAHMSAAENFLGNSVTYLDARVTNKGAKTVSRLDVDLTFVDTLNQVVLRERAHPVSPRTQPLKPGESRAFRVTFEHMPVDWNQAPPSMVPVYVQFQSRS
jgi:hypothetical protein